MNQEGKQPEPGCAKPGRNQNTHSSQLRSQSMTLQTVDLVVSKRGGNRIEAASRLLFRSPLSGYVWLTLSAVAGGLGNSLEPVSVLAVLQTTFLIAGLHIAASNAPCPRAPPHGGGEALETVSRPLGH